jgi:hypothetical protein
MHWHVQMLLVSDLPLPIRKFQGLLAFKPWSQLLWRRARPTIENDPAIDSSMFQDLGVSDMANYWIDFMSMVEVLMMNVYAIHTWLGRVSHLTTGSDALACRLWPD